MYIFVLNNKHYPQTMEKTGYVYILTNRIHSVLYTGVSSDLGVRMIQHRSGYFKDSFTSMYNVNKLVYYEVFESIGDAIAREKQIKAGSRKKKIDLINRMNPGWKDLS
jgi:putative endonuclease